MNGGWGEWAEWGSCNEDSARRTRTRACDSPQAMNGGVECPGDLTDEEDCAGLYENIR